MINEEALERIKRLEHKYEETWGRSVDYSVMPIGMTQEKLVVVLERMIVTGESVTVAFSAIKNVHEVLIEYVMTVDLVFKDDKAGIRIVGAPDPHYPTDDFEWLNFMGKEIMIRTSKRDIFFKVEKIDMFPAISGHINIGLTLENHKLFNSVNVGDKVYKINNIEK